MTAASPPLLSSSTPLGKPVVSITTSTLPGIAPPSLVSNSNRLYREAPHRFPQTSTTLSSSLLPLIQRRPRSSETPAVAEGSPIRPPLHATTGVKLDLSPRGRTRDNTPVAVGSGTGAEVAETGCIVPGDTENSYHDVDEAFGVDSDYSYSVEIPEDYDGLSPRVDESKERTLSEDDGGDMVERQASGSGGGDKVAAAALDGKPSGMRLSRRIARSGVASRREAERWAK